MTENERIIKTQQRSLEKYERTMSEIRGAIAGSEAHPVSLADYKRVMAKARLKDPFALTRDGEPVAVVIPIETLRKLGVVHG